MMSPYVAVKMPIRHARFSIAISRRPMSNVPMGVPAVVQRSLIAPLPHCPIAPLLLLSLSLSVGCSDPDRDRVKATTQANYDRTTGKLTEITYDKNKNGKIDTWVKMDGNRPVSAEIDTDEDGKLDRWEEYGPDGRLAIARWERPKPPNAKDKTMKGKPDAVAYMGSDGLPERIEYSEVSEMPEMKGKESVVRREFYKGTVLLRAEEDTLGLGYMDRFETHLADGSITVEFDETADGKPDRRLTYSAAGALVLTETDPDGNGGYLKKVVPGKKE